MLAEGIASIVIGLMMFYVVGRVFLDNAKGALGEADDDLEEKIAQYIFQIQKLRIFKHCLPLKKEKIIILK